MWGVAAISKKKLRRKQLRGNFLGVQVPRLLAGHKIRKQLSGLRHPAGSALKLQNAVWRSAHANEPLFSASRHEGTGALAGTLNCGRIAALGLLLVNGLLAGAAAQNVVISPTTTLTAETANNTSAADTYTTSANNNLAAGNVSKVDIRTLLYPGATTGVYVHLLPWWGDPSHINIGYTYLNYPPASPTDRDPQITRQVDDMLSRGVQGAIVYWRGPGDSLHPPSSAHHDNVVQYLRNEANLRNGEFKFAISEDGGALGECAKRVTTCNLTSLVISDLQYAYSVFETSPEYLTFQGRPVVFFFTPDRYGTLDWDRITASVPGNPLFIFQSFGALEGFSHAQTAGSFAWVVINRSNPNDWNQSYLTNFYKTGMQDSSWNTMGAVYKGFNDSVSFGVFRLMNQNCGNTWLNTFAEINGDPGRNMPALYSASNQLESLRLVTWSDYEEGTELESGIENCVYVGASLAGSTLNWNLVGGSETKLDHYIVFISLDGENLMPLEQPPVGTSSLDLSKYGLAGGTYTLYVKAIGKPSMSNRMSNAVRYTVGDRAPETTVEVTPTSGSAPLTVSASMTASAADGVVSSTSIDFGDGTVVGGSSATHTYAKPGQYRVTASATDGTNASSSSSALVTATNANPVASLKLILSSDLTAPAPVTADISGSYDPDGTITFAQVDFGDGTVVNAAPYSHTYTLAGTYKAKALVLDNFGAFNWSSETSVTIVGPIVTLSSPTSGNLNSPVHVAAAAMPPSGRGISSFTVLDNGVKIYGLSLPGTIDASAALDISITLMPDEQHKLSVRATDTLRGSGQSTATVWVVNQPPVAALSVTPSSGIVPLAVSASTAASNDPDGSISSSAIDFGDGTTAVGPTAAHTYSKVGLYTVTGMVTDNLGGTAAATQQVHVVYNFSGFFAPIANGAITAGATTPVKFQLSTADNTLVGTATATLDVFLIGTNGSLTSVPVVPSGSANTGDLFRYDPVEQQYVYNLSTKGYVKGSYTLQVTVDDGTVHQVRILVN